MDSQSTEYQKVVDLEKWLQGSNNKLFRNLPGFVVNRLKKMICEKEINTLHNDNIDKVGIDYVNAILKIWTSPSGCTTKMHSGKQRDASLWPIIPWEA